MGKDWMIPSGRTAAGQDYALEEVEPLKDYELDENFDELTEPDAPVDWTAR